MAILACAECGGDVADTAAKCPHCGFDTRSKRLVRWKAWFILTPLAALGALGAAQIFSSARYVAAGIAFFAIYFLGWEVMGRRNIPYSKD